METDFYKNEREITLNTKFDILFHLQTRNVRIFSLYNFIVSKKGNKRTYLILYFNNNLKKKQEMDTFIFMFPFCFQ